MFQVQYNSSGDDTLVYRLVRLNQRSIFFFISFSAAGLYLLALVLGGVIKVPHCVAECVPACVWKRVYKEASAAAVRG